MKKIILIVVAVTLIAALTVGLAGCKLPEVNIDFNDVPEDAQVALGLSALALFNDAIANTYEGDFKRINTLDFYANLGVATEEQDEVTAYYKLGDSFMRTVTVKGEGAVAKKNTGAKLFYYDGETAKIAEISGKNISISFNDSDFDQLAGRAVACTDVQERIEDYNNFTSYVRTAAKLSESHVDQVVFKDNLYYATIKFNMEIGTVNSDIQQAINRAVEGATGADADSIEWTTDTVWNCIFIKTGDKYYLKKTYLYENYKGKQKGVLTATCQQSHISEFFYGEDIAMPTALKTLLGMD